MSTTAQKPATTPIPVQLSAPGFEAFLLPHLSMPKRGPKCKLGSHCVFYLILWVLYRLCSYHHPHFGLSSAPLSPILSITIPLPTIFVSARLRPRRMIGDNTGRESCLGSPEAAPQRNHGRLLRREPTRSVTSGRLRCKGVPRGKRRAWAAIWLHTGVWDTERTNRAMIAFPPASLLLTLLAIQHFDQLSCGEAAE